MSRVFRKFGKIIFEKLLFLRKSPIKAFFKINILKKIY
jgi:hypothetical protein